MARIRTIKPEFFTSDDICSLTPLARLLYIGLWCEADREGRLVWAPRGFKRRYLPDDQCNIDALCAELVDRDLVRLYGGGLAYIPTFLTHQHVNPREAVSRLPEPPPVDHASERVAHASPRVSDASERVSAPCNHAQVGKEGKGKEGKEESDADASGADAPRQVIDLKKEIFDSGVKILVAVGKKEDAARRMIGKWCKDHDDDAVIAAIRLVQREPKVDPISFITACLKTSHPTDGGPRTAAEIEAEAEAALAGVDYR
jgi:hypothetical protein